VVLNELDVFVEERLIPKYTKGTNRERKRNKEYETARQRAIRAKKRGDWEGYKRAKKHQRSVPVFPPHDPHYKRLRYVRYADDSLFGLIGSKEDAEQIKRELGAFLSKLGLEMSEEKTLITHARTGKARFLNYHIYTIWKDTYLSELANMQGAKVRGRNGKIALNVPKDVIRDWLARIQKGQVIRHRAELMNNSDYDIIRSYESRVQGLINYYQMAHNVYAAMSRIRYAYEESLVKTLAAKHQHSVSKIYQKYRMYTAEGKKILAVKIAREGKQPLVASYGKTLIRQNRHVTLKDEKPQPRMNRTEILQRLLHNACELCGTVGEVEGHHIRKLADIKESKKKPKWMLRMIALRRKTLFVCKHCHKRIHTGKYDGKKLA
jgi:hypothetical protein